MKTLKEPKKPIAKPRPLTTKQRLFVKHIIDNPKASATEAAAQTYNVIKRKTAEAIATENLAKPSIISALAAHNQTIENTLINTVTEYQDEDKQWKRTLAVDTAKYIHDKIHGKAKQQLDITSTSVTLAIDLTGTGQPLDEETVGRTIQEPTHITD